MNATRHLVKLVSAAIVGMLTTLVLGNAAWAGPAPLDQPGAPSPETTSNGDPFWTGTSIGLAALAALAVITVVAVVMVTTVRHHHHGAPAAV
jgi:hypothetical protein